MSIRSDELLVSDIMESINRIIEYTNNLNYEKFLKDIKTQDAVIRNFEIIGEAVSKISLQLKNSNSDIPWKTIKDLRNRLIHDYTGINLDIIWDTIQEDLPKLRGKLKFITY